MIAVDTNVLVYGHVAEAMNHEAARKAIQELAEGDVAWGIPVFVVGEFLRVVTNPRGPLGRPRRPSEALAAIDRLLASPSCRTLLPGRRYLPLLRGLIADATPKGNEIFAAQIAAVSLEHGATIILTNDARFGLFSGITVKKLT